ncbi:MAG: UPF0149 family protein [Kangiellaceae bacterium]|nr:UPF0149 family protein [Kangiellaceae bacterium]MCW8998326.1 UPF0149 family protein [Kangiellaceae bacterium]
MPEFDIQSLQSCFEDTQIQSTFGSLYHTLGFITAVASAPEKIPAKEWMPQLALNNSQFEFENKQHSQTLMQGFVSWWKRCDILFEHGAMFDLPKELTLKSDGKPSDSLVEFSTGYLDAYNWLSGSWQQLLPSENEEGVRSLAVLNVIFARFVDEEKVKINEPEFFEQLPGMKDCLLTLPKLISAVGMLGKDIAHQGPQSVQLEENLPHKNIHHAVGRNDSCPCGSGKKFKKCCLH